MLFTLFLEVNIGSNHGCFRILCRVALLSTPDSPRLSGSSFTTSIVHQLISCAEGGGGKIKLLKAGAYKDHAVDISLITHPGITPDAALMTSSAYSSYKIEYFGKVRSYGTRVCNAKLSLTVSFRKHMPQRDHGTACVLYSRDCLPFR